MPLTGQKKLIMHCAWLISNEVNPSITQKFTFRNQIINDHIVYHNRRFAVDFIYRQ